MLSGSVRNTYQEDDGNVQSKRHGGVGEQSTNAKLVDVRHVQGGKLNHRGDDSVHDSTGGGKVVQRNQGIHLEFGGAEQSLDHDQTDRLEDGREELT